MSDEVARVQVHDAACEDDTRAVARALARELRGGDVVHLSGELGAGKTCFVKGMAEGLGIDPDEVRSPTFTFVAMHAGPAGGLSLVHVDLYRAGDASELAELGLQELPGPAAVAAIEWAERLPEGPAPRARVRIDDLGGDARRIRIERPGA